MTLCTVGVWPNRWCFRSPVTGSFVFLNRFDLPPSDLSGSGCAVCSCWAVLCSATVSYVTPLRIAYRTTLGSAARTHAPRAAAGSATFSLQQMRPWKQPLVSNSAHQTASFRTVEAQTLRGAFWSSPRKWPCWDLIVCLQLAVFPCIQTTHYRPRLLTFRRVNKQRAGDDRFYIRNATKKTADLFLAQF